MARLVAGNNDTGKGNDRATESQGEEFMRLWCPFALLNACTRVFSLVTAPKAA